MVSLKSFTSSITSSGSRRIKLVRHGVWAALGLLLIIISICVVFYVAFNNSNSNVEGFSFSDFYHNLVGRVSGAANTAARKTSNTIRKVTNKPKHSNNQSVAQYAPAPAPAPASAPVGSYLTPAPAPASVSDADLIPTFNFQTHIQLGSAAIPLSTFASSNYTKSSTKPVILSSVYPNTSRIISNLIESIEGSNQMGSQYYNIYKEVQKGLSSTAESANAYVGQNKLLIVIQYVIKYGDSTLQNMVITQLQPVSTAVENAQSQ